MKMNFIPFLKDHFNRDTALAVVRALKKLALPIPRRAAEYLKGTEGAVLLLDAYGVVVRIENAVSKVAKRFNDDPCMIRPLGTLKAKDALVEICPGTGNTENPNDLDRVKTAVFARERHFWDSQLTNIGIMPYKGGVPAIRDRLSMDFVDDRTAHLVPAARRMNPNLDSEAEAAQRHLYAPLRQAFDKSMSAQTMSRFWETCATRQREGKLIAGWKEGAVETKHHEAKDAGTTYGQRFK